MFRRVCIYLCCLHLLISLGATVRPLEAGESLFVRAATAAQRHGFSQQRISKTFQVPKGIKTPVQFWTDIYSVYDRNQVLLHDTKYLGIVYQTVDLSDLAPLGDPFAPFPKEVQEARRDRVHTAMEAVRASLLRLAEDPGRNDITRFERTVLKMFSDVPGDAGKFKEASVNGRLRSQTGLKDRFAAGITASGRYMTHIENIFREEHVPWEITRLAMVESMFDLRAFSKVGASGIWQFMPGTARAMGLSLNDLIDERNDPIAATRAAARLLQKNFHFLGSWPLAINAYNAGPGRLRQAVKQLGTTSIVTIIHEFSHPGYQFASRNFYPEFLAALHVFHDRRKIFGELPLADPLRYKAIVTTTAVSLPELGNYTGIDYGVLWELNPGYTKAVYDGTRPLPAGYILKVPQGQGPRFLSAMTKLGQGLARQ